MTVNKQILVGRLGGDPDVRFTSSGTAVCNFSLATSYKYKDEETTTWHNIVVWGNTAEACGKHLAKGLLTYVEGRTQHRKWQDKEGNDRFTTEVVAQNVTFLEWKDKGDAPEGRAKNTQRSSKYRGDNNNDSTASRGRASGRSVKEEDDNLPF